MRRYCLLDNIEPNNFPQKDKGKYIDVSIDEIIRYSVERVEKEKPVSNILTKDDVIRMRFNGILGNYTVINETEFPMEQVRQQAMEQRFLIENEMLLKSWKNIFYSIEYKLDILDDLYLILSYLANEKQDLYFEGKPDINEKMIETIKNVKKSETKNLDRYAYIFDMSQINSSRKDFKISKCGSGVVQLWLLNKKFRNLFVEKTTAFEKYRRVNIYEILKEGKCEGIKYNKSDHIILEKLLGIPTENVLYEYVITCLESKKIVKLLLLFVDELMKYNGERSRNSIIQYIGYDLYAIKCGNKKINEDNRLSIYIILLRLFKEEFNKIYMETLNTALNEYKKYFSISTSIEKVAEESQFLSNVGQPLYLNNPVYQSVVKKRNNLYFLKEIIKETNENQQLRLLEERDQMKEELESYYTEWNRWGREYFSNSRDENVRTKIQKEIITNNYLKYSKDGKIRAPE